MVLVRELINSAGRGRVLDPQAGGDTAAFYPDIADNAASAVGDHQIRCRLAASTPAAATAKTTAAECDVIHDRLFAGLPEDVWVPRNGTEAQAADEWRTALRRNNRADRGSGAMPVSYTHLTLPTIYS